MFTWFVAHWVKAAEYLCSVSDPLARRPFSVSSVCSCVPSPSEHVQVLEVLVKQMCRQITQRVFDVRQVTNQLLRPGVWPRQPTDPSRWNWEVLHIWKWDHSGRISELDMRSAPTAIQWRARSSSLLRTRFLLFIDNQSSLAALVKFRSSSLLSSCTKRSSRRW